MHHRLLAFLAAALFATTASAQELRARISMEEPQLHFFQVEVHFTGFEGDELIVALPVWTPGSYKVRDYARFVEGIGASDGSGSELPLRKLAKSRWSIAHGGADEVVLRYRSFAFEHSVRHSYLDDEQAFIMPGTLLPYVEGQLELPYTVELVPAQDDWKIDTQLASIAPRTFRAPNYDYLVDSPIQVGTQTRFPFEDGGTEFALVVTGEGNLDGEAMAADMAKVVQATGEIFGGYPFERYLFLLRLGPGGGGLEHLDSTALMSSPWRFDGKSGWNGLLSLVAHEFIHAWNVKRIRDEALGPFDYSKEVYTELLWMHEGWTSYYSPILLRRADLKSAKELLDSFKGTVSSYLNRPGRRVQSLAESSYDSWIKFYQTSATTRNSTVDYYGQGAAAALCLDLIVRHNSEGERSLDDVLLALWEEHARAGDPINPTILRETLVRFGGDEVTSFWTRHVEGTEEIDFAHFLGYAGIELELKYDGEEEEDEDESDEKEGEADEEEEEDEDKPWDHGVSPELNWSTSTDGRSVVVRSLERDGVAWKAGFAIGDELLAVGKTRITSRIWSKLLKRHRDEGRIEVLVARNGRLLSLVLPLEGRDFSVKLKKAKEASELQQKVYAGLFEEPFEKPKKEKAEGDGEDGAKKSGTEAQPKKPSKE